MRILRCRPVLDAASRQQPIADPGGLVLHEFGIDLANKVEIQLRRGRKNSFQFALSAGAELDEEQFQQMSGGLCCP